MRLPPTSLMFPVIVLPALLVAGCGAGGESAAPATVTVTVTETVAAAPDPAPEPDPEPEPDPAAASEPAAGAPAAIDACALLTQAEAEAVAATGLNPGTSAGSGDTVICTYTGLPTGPTAQVEVLVGAGVEKFYDIDVELGHEFVDIPALGDEAHLEDYTIFVRSGATWFGVRVVRLDDARLFDQPLQEAAAAALERLPA